MCVQNISAGYNFNSTEDCLYLNVYTPVVSNFIHLFSFVYFRLNTSFKKPGKRKLPVLVYIHGGLFVFVSGAISVMRPDNFMDYDIVVVTLNYRLRPFGKIFRKI